MNTKILMTASSLVLGAVGVLLTFLPNETITYLDIAPNPITTLTFQLLGALYLGFAILNWMAKGTTIGGIYNKPIVTGNFMHFFVGALTLVKVVSEIKTHSRIIISLTVVYVIFGLLFMYVFSTNPTKSLKNNNF